MRFVLLATATLALAAADTSRGAAADPVAEIVTFRLIEGADPLAFAKAVEGLTPYLHKTGAVLSRTLSADDTGLWTDHITWTGMAAAQAAAEALMAEPDAAPFLQMIDAETMSMRHAPIWFSMPKE